MQRVAHFCEPTTAGYGKKKKKKVVELLCRPNEVIDQMRM